MAIIIIIISSSSSISIIEFRQSPFDLSPE